MNTHPRNITLRRRNNDSSSKLIGGHNSKMPGTHRMKMFDAIVLLEKKPSASVVRKDLFDELVKVEKPVVVIELTEDQMGDRLVDKSVHADCFYMPDDEEWFGVMEINGIKVEVQLWRELVLAEAM